MHGSRRIVQAAQNASVHPLIPRHTHAQIFPLYHPRALDVFVHWSMPSQSRTGIALASLDVGAGHGALRELIDAGDGAGSSTRSMYAETQREKEEMVHGLSASGWNALMDPVVVYAKDGGMDHDFENGWVYEPLLSRRIAHLF
jgi:trafficking protein particle complex subunit 8